MRKDEQRIIFICKKLSYKVWEFGPEHNSTNSVFKSFACWVLFHSSSHLHYTDPTCLPKSPARSQPARMPRVPETQLVLFWKDGKKAKRRNKASLIPSLTLSTEMFLWGPYLLQQESDVGSSGEFYRVRPSFQVLLTPANTSNIGLHPPPPRDRTKKIVNFKWRGNLFKLLSFHFTHIPPKPY